MKKISLILILVFIGNPSVASSRESTANYLVGVPSCGAWIKQRAADKEIYEAGWLAGFLSGISTSLGNQRVKGRDFLEDADMDSISLWVDNYCRDNPLDNLSTAGDRLVRTLINKKR